MKSLAERLAATVPALPNAGLRVAFVRFEMERAELGAWAEAMNTVAEGAEQADAAAREVLAAFAIVLTHHALTPQIEALQHAAAQHHLLPLERMLRGHGQGGATAWSGDDGPTAALRLTRGGRELTLGERKSLARRSPRAMLTALLRDPHPMVVRNALVNPRLTEDDVVRVIAARPASVIAIVEVARHPAFSQRPRVRRALVQNPGTPPEVSVPLVRLLLRAELVEVAHAPDVPPLVRAAAQEQLARRPPVPEDHEPPDPQ